MSPAVSFPLRLAAAECLTPLGDTTATYSGLLGGRRALSLHPVLGRDGGDAVPLALYPERPYDETDPPGWRPVVARLWDRLPGEWAEGWGTARRPVFVTSSNFGVGSLQAFRRTGATGHLRYGTPFACVDWLAGELGWGPHVTTFSHACVSAHLGLLQAARELAFGRAEAALVFTFDFVSPFVAGGFHALKILNDGFPAPYADRPTGSIGLGDGAALAVLTRDRGDLVLQAQSVHNEMHHFTSNQTDGAGFAACLAPVVAAAQGRRVWVKGHGTGTLEAGRLEAAAVARAFPGRPLVSWKGSLGHTLGSCGVVELALAAAALRHGRAPGTVGTSGPCFAPEVATESFTIGDCHGVVCASNAFGGAHAAFLLCHD
jgi:hypothetical protein